MQGATNQERILGSLFESSKTTAELANELGYIDSKGSPRYNIIYRDLKKLEEYRYIESKKEKLDKKTGNIPTLYSIPHSTKIFSKILEEYPNLIENVQNSELALDTIIQEKFSWISSSAEHEYTRIENLSLLKKRGKESWKEKLRLSWEFLRYCIHSEYTDMLDDIEKFTKISTEYWETTFFEFKTSPTYLVYLWETNYRIEMIFKACVASDILREQAKKEAIEYLEQRKNEALEEQYEQLREFYNSTKVAPEFIRGKEFISVENPKICEIEQEFLDNGGKYV